ncbi:MAG: TetR family transcriptional regulator C-terminal domain-containing protein [Deltaproteobacteria bacterium]|nr:TetR family transcriptional regulator C-terminal domain-containing protein [Deltaproteobacteria bacterium]
MSARAIPKKKYRRLAAIERRESLISAALDCLSQLGPQGAGVREICDRAGVSPGLLRHYFDGKHELIVEAYRALTHAYHRSLRDVLTGPAESAEQRMRSFFDAYFLNPSTGEERVGAYIAFWALGRTEPKIQRIQRSAYRKLRKLLAPALNELARERGVRIDAERVATGLVALLDGFWLDMCVDPKRFSRAKTSAACWEWLETYLRGSRRS